MEADLGAPSLAVHRADVHRALLAALPAGTVHTGLLCTGFTQDESGVTASFSDATTARGDLLVGADGIHSVIRQQLFPGVTLRYAGYAAWRGVVAGDAFAHIDRTSETWGCGSRFGIVPIGGGRIYWFATGNLPSGLRHTPAEHKAALLRRFQAWHAPVEELIAATPDDKILYNDIFDFPPLERWSIGRVTLLGDAAHATTPNLGQGACQAIESSLALSRTLSRALSETTDIPAALLSYERERRPRTAWITNTSWQLGKVAQLENPLACRLRNLAVRLAPPSAMRSQILKAAGYKF
jgi:2-polyprenyl-6-methoxyphenol hydroxylase-like FAD-dependent oxidoreductase